MSALVAPRRSVPATESTAAPVRVSFMIDRLSRAGTESQLLALIRELDRTKVRPSLVLLDGEDDLSRAPRTGQLPHRSPRCAATLQRQCGTGGATTAGVLARGTARRRCRLYFLDAAYFGAPIAKMSGVKTVVRVRNNLGYWLTPRHRARSPGTAIRRRDAHQYRSRPANPGRSRAASC